MLDIFSVPSSCLAIPGENVPCEVRITEECLTRLSEAIERFRRLAEEMKKQDDIHHGNENWYSHTVLDWMCGEERWVAERGTGMRPIEELSR